MTRLFRLLFTRRASASDAARTLASIGPERQRAAVRAKALEIAERMGRADLVKRLQR